MKFKKTGFKKLPLYRPHLGSVMLSVCVALFLLFTSNRTFWSKINTYLAQEPVAIAMLYIAMSAFFIAALTVFSAKYVIKPFFIFLVMTSATASWFVDQFGVVIDSDMMRNAYQTTPAEAQHLITWGFVGASCPFRVSADSFYSLGSRGSSATMGEDCSQFRCGDRVHTCVRRRSILVFRDLHCCCS